MIPEYVGLDQGAGAVERDNVRLQVNHIGRSTRGVTLRRVRFQFSCASVSSASLNVALQVHVVYEWPVLLVVDQ